MKFLRGYVWFARRFGLRTLWRYERVRRAGFRVDYGRIFTAKERAALEEEFDDVPWRRSTGRRKR